MHILGKYGILLLCTCNRKAIQTTGSLGAMQEEVTLQLKPWEVCILLLCIYCTCNRKAIQSTGSLGGNDAQVLLADIHPGSTIKFTILVNATLYRQPKEHCRQTTGSLGPRVNNVHVLL